MIYKQVKQRLKKMKGVSVIICCYNSAPRLPETLKHICLQKVLPGIKWEVIIVNNNSTDDTAQIAALEWARHQRNDVSFKIIQQPVSGLSYAREKGLNEAVYDYLLFCDDDNWLQNNYVQNAFDLLESSANVGIVGGYGIPELEISPPDWFSNYCSYYATGAQNSQNGVIKGDSPYIYGAGCVIRRSVFQRLRQLNFKFLATGRYNDKLSSGEDVELCYAAKLTGYEIAYSDDLKFYHFIQKSRLTDQYLLNLVYQFGYCNILHRPYFWLFNPNLPWFKKTWLWTLLISFNIYLISLFNLLKKGDRLNKFTGKVNLSHAKGRLVGIIKLRSGIERDHRSIQQKFNTVVSADI